MRFSRIGWRTYTYTSFILLLLALAACSGGSNTGNGSSSATRPGRGTSSLTPTGAATAGIGLGAQPCPNAVKSPSHWTAIVLPPTGAQVESVSCGNLMGKPTLEALVTVRSHNTGNMLDVYVYNHITDPNPSPVFKLEGLYMGEAKISGYNTVMTGEVDQNSSINKNVGGNASPTVDLFREFKWLDGAGTLVPVTFPGLFPDLTRYQAENDQAQVNQGQDAWKLDAAQTTKALAVSLLKWSNNAQATIVSGGGAHDVDAVVNVKNAATPAGTITVSLSRLEGNTNGGIWEATSVTSNDMSITSPPNRDLLSSPVTVNGTDNTSNGATGRVTVLDHLYTQVGQANTPGSSTAFSTPVSFTSSFQNGHEEGILALYNISNANGTIAGAVMMKELL
jgi:hypothetical protein